MSQRQRRLLGACGECADADERSSEPTFGTEPHQPQQQCLTLNCAAWTLIDCPLPKALLDCIVTLTYYWRSPLNEVYRVTEKGCHSPTPVCEAVNDGVAQTD